LKGDYTLIVPALDRTGPVNVAVDIGMAAREAGWRVRLLFLTAVSPRGDLDFAHEVRQLRFADFWRLRGVVHTHCLRPDLLGFAFSLNRKVTLVTTLHNFFLIDVSFDKPRLYVLAAWQLWRQALRTFDQVVCISESMRRYYRRCLPDQTMNVAYNFRTKPLGIPLDSAAFDWIQRRRSCGDIVLSFVGSLSQRKNILGLVSALAEVRLLSLVICGQGPLREELEEIVRHRGLQDRVRLEGQVVSPSSIVRHTDALVLPSYAEGFPLAVLEAASVGVPALMSNIAVHRELARLGFGQTFDHRGFTDLATNAATLAFSTPAPSSALISLWSDKFTPQVGFSRYEKLILESKKESTVSCSPKIGQ
jgi:glycosyltransferase involved in cell wall biosynthesis